MHDELYLANPNDTRTELPVPPFGLLLSACVVELLVKKLVECSFRWPQPQGSCCRRRCGRAARQKVSRVGLVFLRSLEDTPTLHMGSRQLQRS
jgi:hypothetical protein